MAIEVMERAEEDHVQVIEMSEKERHACSYGPYTLQKALAAMNQDGLVLLRGVVDPKHIESLNIRMCADADKKRANPDLRYNPQVKSNFLQRPPVTDATYLFEDVYYNSFVLQLANAYLGHKPIWNWLTANTALSNTDGMRQPAHKDCSFVHPRYPYYVIANIPLCEFGIENGATEFWLGSHAYASWREQVMVTSLDQLVGGFGRWANFCPTSPRKPKKRDD